MESSCRFDIDFYILSASNTDEIIPDFQIYKSLWWNDIFVMITGYISKLSKILVKKIIYQLACLRNQYNKQFVL